MVIILIFVILEFWFIQLKIDFLQCFLCNWYYTPLSLASFVNFLHKNQIQLDPGESEKFRPYWT